jgi:hypothetical protein
MAFNICRYYKANLAAAGGGVSQQDINEALKLGQQQSEHGYKPAFSSESLEDSIKKMELYISEHQTDILTTREARKKDERDRAARLRQTREEVTQAAEARKQAEHAMWTQ